MKFLLAGLCLIAGCQAAYADAEWQNLFNGKDLSGWTPKFAGQELGVNYRDTFRVEGGVLKVDYSNYSGFNGEFGHLFYKAPFTAYRLRMEYRFHGEQVDGGPGWAFRNSGVMVHSQAPETMTNSQEFPVSIEVQFLGQVGDKKRPTGNLCTPGTHVVMNSRLIKDHCIASGSPTFPGDGWVKAEVEVRGDATIIHYIEGQEVLRYQAPQLDPEDPDAALLVKEGSLMLGGGYIALQAESHPLEFRNIQIKALEE